VAEIFLLELDLNPGLVLDLLREEPAEIGGPVEDPGDREAADLLQVVNDDSLEGDVASARNPGKGLPFDAEGPHVVQRLIEAVQKHLLLADLKEFDLLALFGQHEVEELLEDALPDHKILVVYLADQRVERHPALLALQTQATHSLEQLLMVFCQRNVDFLNQLLLEVL